MSWLQSLYASTVGKKAVMAITGLIIFGFTIGHLAGNLQMFGDPDLINEYSHFLKSSPALLWGTRIVLLVAIPLHIATALSLVRRSREARGGGYRDHQHQATSLAARTMAAGGVLLGVFIVFHLLHFTLLLIDRSYATMTTTIDGVEMHDVYGMVVDGFSNPLIVGFYVLAMVALGMHLSHGAWSFMQSLGLNHPNYNEARRKFALTFAVLLSAGFASIPLAVLFNVISL